MTDEAQPSPLQAALDRVGDRWSLLVVESLLDGARRFNDLAAALPGIAPNILSDRLKRLERERVLVARPYSQHPLRLSYELTAEGRELAGPIRPMSCAIRVAGRPWRRAGTVRPARGQSPKTKPRSCAGSRRLRPSGPLTGPARGPRATS